MQPTKTIIALILPLLVSAGPLPEDAAAASIQKRSLTCEITGSQVNRRRCASTSCESIGQYAKGTSVVFKCYTTGEAVNGVDAYWERDSAGFYVYDEYVALPCFGPENGLPHC